MQGKGTLLMSFCWLDTVLGTISAGILLLLMQLSNEQCSNRTISSKVATLDPYPHQYTPKQTCSTIEPHLHSTSAAKGQNTISKREPGQTSAFHTWERGAANRPQHSTKILIPTLLYVFLCY
eukprot:GHRR01019073.1.p1 GENE.GHRR01019073.1~~GHRR01019073.1.p1  ORF type:complete len:122 (-),score=21.17 GHRR01019073.1:364-729(-)